jgi:uncharacterized membrane protein (DUF4010 family)
MEGLLFLQKILFALAVGALIGLEREYSKHQQTVGMRTFALVSFLGALASMVKGEFTQLAFVSVVALSVLFYFFKALQGEFGLTTVVTLPLAFIFGILVGYGMYFEALAASLLTTVMLISGRRTHRFVRSLTRDEIMDALEFGIIAFVVYPLLPDAPLAAYGITLDLKLAWGTVILVSLIGLAAFLAIRNLGSKAVAAIGFMGGLVNSTATVASLAAKSREAYSRTFVAGFAAASAAMLLRDVVIVALVSTALLQLVFLPAAAMFTVLALLTYTILKHERRAVELSVAHPFAVMPAIKFGALFLLIMAATSYASSLGFAGFVFAAALASIVSSASTVASVSFAFASGGIGTETAVTAIILAYSVSLASNAIILALRGERRMAGKALPAVALAITLGAAALLAQGYLLGLI